MKNVKLIALMCCIYGSISAHASTESSSRIAAVINNSHILTHADVNHRLKLAALTSGLPATKDVFERIKPDIIKMMIDEQLQIQRASTHKIIVTEEMINQAISRYEAEGGMPSGMMTQVLKQNDIPISVLQNQIKANLAWTLFIQKEYGPVLHIMDTDIEQEIDKSTADLKKTQYHLAELVLEVDTPAQDKKVLSAIQKYAQDIKRSGRFREIAQQFSQAPSATQGGDLGWLTDSEIAPEILTHVHHMKVGEISSPIRTRSGYTLIAVIEKLIPNQAGEPLITFAQTLIPFKGEPTNDVVENAQSQAAFIKKQSSSCSAFVKVVKENNKNNKVQLINKAPLNSLPDPIQQVLTGLNSNEISQALLTPEGIVMFMVCGREIHKREPLTTEKARLNLIQRRLAAFAKREIRDLRRHATIDLRM